MSFDPPGKNDPTASNRFQIHVSLLPGLESVSPEADVAIVIDVLRATSVITTAFANGAKRVMTCESIEQARALQNQMQQQGANPLLCGERACRPIEGFDLGNSPAEYSAETVGGRDLIVTTTNGTRAIQTARVASQVWLASFLNLGAILDRLHAGAGQTIANLHLVCAGTEQAITMEDVLLAGCLVHSLKELPGHQLVGDQPRLASLAFQSCLDGKTELSPDLLCRALRDTQGGRNLIQRGYEPDLARCSQVRLHDVVPLRMEETESVVTFGLD